MSADYSPALWIPTDHHGGWVFQPRYIILHGTAGGTSAQAIAQYFQTNNPPTSTHYVVGVDGTVAQCVSESEPAWGNGVITAGHAPWWTGNPNAVTFSIEHCKPSADNSDHLSPAQQAASFALVKHLCETHGIPKRAADASGGITGHASIDPVNRAFCPGPYPWDSLYSYLNGGSTTMAWQQQADGTGKDAHGHVCGTGVMGVLADKNNAALAAADGLMSERFRGSVDAVLPLANGHCITAHHDVTSGVWDVQPDDAGGLALLVGLLTDVDAQLAVAHADPLAAAALALLRQFKAVEAQV